MTADLDCDMRGCNGQKPTSRLNDDSCNRCFHHSWIRVHRRPNHLSILSLELKKRRKGSKNTFPPYISTTRTSPSNFPTVYILDVPTWACPSRVYQICRLPPPRSGPVARNSSSAVHSDCETLHQGLERESADGRRILCICPNCASSVAWIGWS